jgi:hypothetical protein
MKLLLVMLATLIMLTACQAGIGRPMVGPPWKQKMLLNGPDDSPPKFREGWKDGCETSIAANANHLQKFFYKFKQNGYMAQDPVYYAGWKVARDYCQKFIFSYLNTDYIAGELGNGMTLFGGKSFWGGGK